MSTLSFIDRLSIRSGNALLAAGLDTRCKISSYFNTYYTFKNIPNIGRKGNMEIISLLGYRFEVDSKLEEAGFNLKRSHDLNDYLTAKNIDQQRTIEGLLDNAKMVADDNSSMHNYVNVIGKYHRYLLKVLSSHDVDFLSLEDFEDLI